MAVINVCLQVPFVLGAKRAMGAIERGRFAAFVEQMPLEYVSVFVALAAARAIVPAIESGHGGDGADRAIVVSARMTRGTV